MSINRLMQVWWYSSGIYLQRSHLKGLTMQGLQLEAESLVLEGHPR